MRLKSCIVNNRNDGFKFMQKNSVFGSYTCIYDTLINNIKANIVDTILLLHFFDTQQIIWSWRQYTIPIKRNFYSEPEQKLLISSTQWSLNFIKNNIYRFNESIEFRWFRKLFVMWSIEQLPYFLAYKTGNQIKKYIVWFINKYTPINIL